MKRKLFLGLAAMAALTITSCQKDLVINQIPEEQPIGFGTYVGRDAQTKASVTDVDVMKVYEGVNNYPGFGIFAYYTSNFDFDPTDYDTETSGNQAPTPNFMYNQNVDWNGTKWDYSPEKYWPNSTDKISFFAYAPYTDVTSTPRINVTGFSGNNIGGYPTVSFTVAENVSEQVDLLYANAINQNYTNNNTGVSLSFGHALSRIGFKAAATNATDKIAVTKITLSGKFIPSGTCSLNDGKITGIESTEAIKYILNYTSTNKVFVEGTNAQEISADEGYIMIIPKANVGSANKINISVEYELSVKDDALSDGYSAPVKHTATGELSSIYIENSEEKGFEKGKAYTFVLNLSPKNPISFTVSVSNWNTNINGDNSTNDDITAIPTPAP